MARWGFVLLLAALLTCSCGSSQVRPLSPPDRAILSQAPRAGVEYVAIVGDSDTSGSQAGGVGANGWPALVTANLRDAGITIKPRIGASGDSRYVVGAGSKVRSFSDEVGRVVGSSNRLVVVFGSRNDGWNDAPPFFHNALVTAIHDTLAKVKKMAPNAALLVIGPAWTTWTREEPTPAIHFVTEALNAQATASGAVFIDPIAERWFADRPDLIGADGVNPNDAGHAFMAEKIGPLMTQLLNTASAPSTINPPLEPTPNATNSSPAETPPPANAPAPTP